MIAAFDYRRSAALLDQASTGRLPTLLFIAHRDEILRQSRRTFREVLRNSNFGELLVGDEKPEAATHLFASIQSLHRLDLRTVAPGAFEVVIVDEFHHAEATSYRRCLAHLRPQLLLGLTATPERSDGVRVQDEFFAGHVAAELRLWDAIDRGLLAPFHWFGIHDGTDLRNVAWRRGNYDTAELERIYTGDDARVRLVLQQIDACVADSRRMRALAFCVSVAHATFMAQRFRSAGYAALAVTGDTPIEERRTALADLDLGRLQVVFTVDLFNEGIDLPHVDTLLLLRPTQSATLFQQQLGRGLRLAEGKNCCTVLDFIGNVRSEFRFDLRLGSLLDSRRRKAIAAVEEGFPRLPAGCSMQLDRVAKEIVLENLRSALRNRRSEMIRTLRTLGPETRMAAFLEETGHDLHDVYRKPGDSWTSLRHDAEFRDVSVADVEVARFLLRLVHVDDTVRLGIWRDALGSASPPELGTTDVRTRRAFAMLAADLVHSRMDRSSVEDVLARLWRHDVVRREAIDLLNLVADRRDHVDREFSQRPDVPLRLHARYGLHEIAAGFGLTPTALHQKGVHFDAASACDLLLVTLDKSEKDYSPTTMYRDHAISQELFHWETQSGTAANSATTRRYVSARLDTPDHCVLLFVRRGKQLHTGGTEPYVFLGPVEAVQHDGSRPVQIVWRLGTPMPAWLLRDTRLAAG